MIRPTYLIIRHDALKDPIVIEGSGEALTETLAHYHSENGSTTFDVYELKDAPARTYEFRNVIEHRTIRDAPRTCQICGEEPRGTDPKLSNGICVFCGYFGVKPGTERENMRALREKSKP